MSVSSPIPMPVMMEIAIETGRSVSTVRRALAGCPLTAPSRASLTKALQKRGLAHLLPAAPKAAESNP